MAKILRNNSSGLYCILVVSQAECFVELSGFADLARFACAFREYPKRIYSQMHDGRQVLSSSVTLANTLLVFYSSMPKDGRYVSYRISSASEECSIVESTKDISHYAPIIHAASEISALEQGDLPDRFHPVRIRDLGSLARLTFDPDFPDEQDLTLYAVPYKKSWVLGYVTALEMDDIYYHFNYVEMDAEPEKHFLAYRGNHGQDPVFSNVFEHGSTYLPIIKIKDCHRIFGLE